MWRRLLEEYLERPIRPVVWPLIRYAKGIAARGPRTFSEKVRYKMFHDRRPLLTTFADKVKVRDYVRDRIGPEILTPVHAVYTDAHELDPETLPRNMALKVSHAAGGVVVVWDGASPAATLEPLRAWERRVVHPDSLDWDKLRRAFVTWLRLNYGGIKQWAYQHVPRRILVEELLLDSEGKLPRDYKFYVFHGRCRYVLVVGQRYGKRTKDLFDVNWQPAPVSFKTPRSEPPLAPPSNLANMVEIAEALGADTDFVRVDLYDLGDQIRFGELTNYPNASRVNFSPREFDEELGRTWDPPRSYGSALPAGARFPVPPSLTRA